VNDCAGTNTPSVLDAAQFVTVRQETGSSTTSTVPSSTGECMYIPHLYSISNFSISFMNVG